MSPATWTDTKICRLLHAIYTCLRREQPELPGYGVRYPEACRVQAADATAVPALPLLARHTTAENGYVRNY
jgi:hypothetical protein